MDVDALFNALMGDKEGRLAFAREAGIDLDALEKTNEGSAKDTALFSAICEVGKREVQTLTERVRTAEQAAAGAQPAAPLTAEHAAAGGAAGAQPAAPLIAEHAAAG